MQSTARNVTDYLDEVPTERKAALTKLRDLYRTSLKGFEESMKYGVPATPATVKLKWVSQAKRISLGCIFSARLYPIFENLLKADLSDFISVEMSLLRVFKHRFFSLMFENSGAKSASASLLLTLLFFKMDKVELRRKRVANDDCPRRH